MTAAPTTSGEAQHQAVRRAGDKSRLTPLRPADVVGAMRLRSDGTVENEPVSGSTTRSSAESAALQAAARPLELPPRLAAVDPAQVQQAAALTAQLQPRRDEAAATGRPAAPEPGLLRRVAQFLFPDPVAARPLTNVSVIPPGTELPAPMISKELLEVLRRASEPYVPAQHEPDGRLRITHPRSIIGVRG